MEGIAKWFADLSWPLISRALSAMGVGTVTYIGAESALDSALTAAKNSFAGIAAEVAQLLAMAGFFDAMAIMSGGLVSGLAWMVMKRFALQTSGQS